MVFEHNQQQKLNVDESQQPNSSTSHSQQMKTIDRPIDCRICMETALSMAFIPCGHTLCNNCSEMILKDHVCCFCKQRISYVQKLYFWEINLFFCFLFVCFFQKQNRIFKYGCPKQLFENAILLE